MPVMMAVGLPVYVCATASVPVAAALIMKGVSPLAAPMVVWIDGPGGVHHDLTVVGGDMAPGEFLRRMREVR